MENSDKRSLDAIMKDMNRILKKDEDCKEYLPITEESLSNTFRKGVVFAKLINIVQPNSVHKDDFKVVVKSYEIAANLNLVDQ